MRCLADDAVHWVFEASPVRFMPQTVLVDVVTTLRWGLVARVVGWNRRQSCIHKGNRCYSRPPPLFNRQRTTKNVTSEVGIFGLRSIRPHEFGSIAGKRKPEGEISKGVVLLECSKDLIVLLKNRALSCEQLHEDVRMTVESSTCWLLMAGNRASSLAH